MVSSPPKLSQERKTEGWKVASWRISSWLPRRGMTVVREESSMSREMMKLSQERKTEGR